MRYRWHPVGERDLSEERAVELLDDHLRLYYGITVDDVEPDAYRGHWRAIWPCVGCHFGHVRPLKHAYSFAEWGIRDERGRFVSPFRVWRTLRRAHLEVGIQEVVRRNLEW